MKPDPATFAATLIERLDASDQDLTLPLHVRSTISPERSSADEAGRGALAMLRRTDDAGDGLEMSTTLGEGGMGVVRVARQVRLGREVAVKSLREEFTDEVSTLTLLREAWVTGMLEHPNVVPVHDVSLDARGQPRIVLKRIGGSPWSELLGNDAEVRKRFGASDPFEWHARVFLQVANAVQFAHSRGILHRDIKPENVMVGAFGEVYLLDWGIAVSLVDDGTGRLPLARDAVELAGTPVYMAPEMVCGQPERLSIQTDVYLLGAVLFELVAGQPPHDGANLREIIARILVSPPQVPAACPPELARIVEKAMALEPSDRFADVEALRSALIAYLEHRGSLSLAADASLRAAELERTLAADETASVVPEDRRVLVYRMFAEARFGFLEALRAWPANEAARRGLRDAVEKMVSFELSAGDPRAAALLLSEIETPEPSLVRHIESARAEQARTQRRRQQLEADLDPATGRRTRLLIAGAMGVAWTFSPLLRWWLERRGVVQWTLDDALKSSAVMIVVACTVAWWARDTLSKTAVNRRLRNSTAIVLVAQLALVVVGRALGVDMLAVETLKLVLYATVAAQIAVTIEPGLWWAVGGYVAAFTVAAVAPWAVYLVEGAASAILTVTVLAVWGRARPPNVPPRSARGGAHRADEPGAS